MPYRLDFRDVLIHGVATSWTVVLPTFGAQVVLDHLQGRGMTLKCSGGERNPDLVLCDEWDDEGGDGRILRGSTRLIGRFRVRYVTEAQAETVMQRECEEASAEANATEDAADPEMEAAPEAEESLDRLCIRMGIRRGFSS